MMVDNFKGIASHRTVLKNYPDHANNERTYLSWVRTSLTFMSFGLVIEKIDRFVVSKNIEPANYQAISLSGTGMFLLSLLMLLLATGRYFHIKCKIQREQELQVGADLINVFLTVIVLLVAGTLFFGIFLK